MKNESAPRHQFIIKEGRLDRGIKFECGWDAKEHRKFPDT
jgi:hypothetical protein